MTAELLWHSLKIRPEFQSKSYFLISWSTTMNTFDNLSPLLFSSNKMSAEFFEKFDQYSNQKKLLYIILNNQNEHIRQFSPLLMIRWPRNSYGILEKNRSEFQSEKVTFYYPEQPRQPQWTHSTIFPSSSFVLGTLQMQLVAKLVSRDWIHLERKKKNRQIKASTY